MLVSSLSYRSLPSGPGVYLFLDEEGNVLYVGKAKDIKSRVSSYFTDKNNLTEKTKLLVEKISKIKTVDVTSEIESLLLEANLIKKYSPRYNVRLTDGKSYPLIRITAKDKYPKVLVSRNTDDKNSIYFGPYPSAGAMRLVLKIIRKIFPYQAVSNHSKKPCLYYHLGLCPCPEVFKDLTYKKTVKRIIKFLNGNSKLVIKDLEKERNLLTDKERFEKAKEIQKKINSIKLITSSFYKPFEYENNPNLKNEILSKESLILKEELEKNGMKIKNLKRIECFDISNISGQHATGSMVVFINGEKDSSKYRRFKIKNDYNNKPNDFGMMKEVLKRRFNHKDWDYPDLLIVDGGKGQVTSAVSVLSDGKFKIPIIGLAKKEETIITKELKEISLPKDSKALHLIMRIRDEAHRFAIIYHRKLRSKYLLS